MIFKAINRLLISSLCLLAVSCALQSSEQNPKNTVVTETDQSVIITTENYIVEIEKQGFRYEFRQPDGKIVAPAHPHSGIQIGLEDQPVSNVVQTRLLEQKANHVRFEVETDDGVRAEILLTPEDYAVKMQVTPVDKGKYTIIGRTAGLGPAYGMADHAAYGGRSWRDMRPTVELTGFDMDSVRHDRSVIRMQSNFVIFPTHGFANVNIEPGDKVVRITGEENVQGSRDIRLLPALYYFVGSPKQIYQSFLDVRNKEGYPVYKPKYQWFGVGWEAFGALAWNTNHETVKENINQYLELGYPLEWMVIGSGFWPSGDGEFDEHGSPLRSITDEEAAAKLRATTSFGMWDAVKYPDPKATIRYFQSRGLKVNIGLRIGFIQGGPFTQEGLDNNYFIENEKGEPQLFRIAFPRSPSYLLNTRNPQAVEWYVGLSQKWLDYGIDGFKEDLYGFPQELPDDLIDPVNRALMDKGVYIMGRNQYLGSPSDIHRYDDFNHNHFQDRGPINGLAYAYSGFPYVYPDIVGGTGLATRFGDESKDQLAVYLMRYAEYAALHPSMSFGFGPWNFDDEVVQVTRNAAMLHDRLQPYTYSYAIKAYKTGFPYPKTPLPLAYPDDPGVYGLANTTRRSYQWLIGESLLATPLYGDDYATATSRDVYLPRGTWMEYDSGKVHNGPTTLANYPLPIGKTALFVGGSGIVVEEIDGQLKGRLYPVTDYAEMIFYDKDGETQSTITLANPDWENPTVVNQSTGKQVIGSWNRHAYEFLFTPGYNYTVE